MTDQPSSTNLPGVPTVAAVRSWSADRLLAAMVSSPAVFGFSQHTGAAIEAPPADTIWLEVDWLLSQELGLSRAQLLSLDDRVLSAEEAARAERIITRRVGGEPLAYLLGSQPFRHLDFAVTPDTLIPRSDTELLVDQTLEAPAPVPPGTDRVRVLELGTGSGAIACCLADLRPTWQIVATDLSHAALRVAADNAQRLLPGRTGIQWVRGDWLAPFAPDSFSLIVSNPPYLAADDVHFAGLAFEPRAALSSGADGLDAIRRIVGSAGGHLIAAGRLLLEHGDQQGPPVRELLRAAGFEAVTTCRDTAGRERVSVGCKSS